jgi:tyrosyl-tRNA synthetase
MLIALGVSGGIGAYKAVEVARGLQKQGHEVVAVMTAHATRFVGAITFESITRRRVITDQFEPGANAVATRTCSLSPFDLEAGPHPFVRGKRWWPRGGDSWATREGMSDSPSSFSLFCRRLLA